MFFSLHAHLPFARLMRVCHRSCWAASRSRPPLQPVLCSPLFRCKPRRICSQRRRLLHLPNRRHGLPLSCTPPSPRRYHTPQSMIPAIPHRCRCTISSGSIASPCSPRQVPFGLTSKLILRIKCYPAGSAPSRQSWSRGAYSDRVNVRHSEASEALRLQQMEITRATRSYVGPGRHKHYRNAVV